MMTTPHDILADAELEVLPIAVLLVDESYQREEREHLIKKILRKGFDMNAAYPIIVSERPPLPGMHDPRYYIVDGRHRTKSAERSGETEVLARIVRFKGSEAKLRMQEADLRGKFGDRKADTPMERFKHKLASGDTSALKIDALVESYGGTIALSQGQRTGVHSISTLEKLYEKDLLDRVLRIIKVGWDTFEGRAGESASLDGIAWLVSKHEELDEQHLTRRMKGIPPEALHARANAIKAGAGGSLWKNYYRALLEVYNARIPAKVKKLTPVDW
jgi:hypothetical protein